MHDVVSNWHHGHSTEPQDDNIALNHYWNEDTYGKISIYSDEDWPDIGKYTRLYSCSQTSPTLFFVPEASLGHKKCINFVWANIQVLN